jgi:hypothetical protein
MRIPKTKRRNLDKTSTTLFDQLVKTHKITRPRAHIRALITPDSFDESDLSFAVVFATERAVFQAGEYDEPFDEILGMDPGEVRLERLNSGAPVVDSHNRWSLADQIGVVVEGSANVDGVQGSARLRLLPHESNDRVIAGVKSKVFTNVSIGYQVFAYRDVSLPNDDRRTLRAVDWEPYEITLIPVPADISAGVRSQDSEHLRSSVDFGELKPPVTTMPKKPEPAPAENLPIESNRGADPAPVSAPVSEPATPAPRTAAPADPNPELLAQTRSAAIAEERTRVATIEREAGRMGIEIDSPFVRGLVDNGTALDGETGARALMIDRAANLDDENSTNGTRSGFKVTREEGTTALEGMENALLYRCGYSEPDKNGRTRGIDLDENARRFIGMSVLDLATYSLELHGVRGIRFKTKPEIAKLALRGFGGAVTGDFPSLLANVGNKRLQNGFTAAPRSFLPLVSHTRFVQDFKQMSSQKFGGGPSLDVVLEDGAYSRVTIGEGSEVYTLVKYGRIWNYTWEAMLNDDLSAFDRVPSQMGANAARKESDVVWTDLITGNVVMGDGNALFDNTNHANDISSASPINVANLGALRKKMRDQTGIDGERIDLFPTSLIVGTGDETLAQQFTANLTPNAGGSVNPFASAFQNVIVEPRIAFNGWYFTASPSQGEVLEVARLAGSEGPMIETKSGWDIDGIEIKVRHQFAAQIPEHRTWARAVNA